MTPPTDDQGSRTDRGHGSEGGGASQGAATLASDAHLEPEVSIFRILNIVLRHRYLVAGLPVLAMVIGLTTGIFAPGSYTTTTSFTPQTDQPTGSRLSGLAMEFGINLQSAGTSQSPQFYANLVQNREFLRDLVLTRYELPSTSSPGDTLSGTLVDLLQVEGDERDERIRRAIERLRERIDPSTDTETGVVQIQVTTSSPQMSQRVAKRILDLVHQFNVDTRQTRAGAERQFLESQLKRTRKKLERAEDSLQTFLENNRRYERSPELQLEYDRLQRRVNMRQQLYTSVAQSYQQASIDEVRNTPVVTVVQPPRTPASPNSRHVILRGILGLLLGGMVGLVWAGGREVLRSSKEEDPDDYAEFRRLISEAKSDLLRAWGRSNQSDG